MNPAGAAASAAVSYAGEFTLNNPALNAQYAVKGPYWAHEFPAGVAHGAAAYTTPGFNTPASYTAPSIGAGLSGWAESAAWPGGAAHARQTAALAGGDRKQFAQIFPAGARAAAAAGATAAPALTT